MGSGQRGRQHRGPQVGRTRVCPGSTEGPLCLQWGAGTQILQGLLLSKVSMLTVLGSSGTGFLFNALKKCVKIHITQSVPSLPFLRVQLSVLNPFMSCSRPHCPSPWLFSSYRTQNTPCETPSPSLSPAPAVPVLLSGSMILITKCVLCMRSRGLHLSDWLISLSVVSSRFIHVTYCRLSFPFKAK